MKNIVITGGTRGIGAETAKLLAGERYRVLITGRNSEPPEFVEKYKPKIQFAKYRGGNIRDVNKLINWVKNNWDGQINGLVNNAGMQYMMSKLILIILLFYSMTTYVNKTANITLNPVIIAQTKNLIKSGTSYNLEALDSIYSPELRIVRLDEKGNVTVINKEENMNFFRAKRQSGSTPLSKQTEFHYAEIKGNRGYVYLTRVMKLAERWEELKYHIEWEYSKGRWQVVHENVYAQPLNYKLK